MSLLSRYKITQKAPQLWGKGGDEREYMQGEVCYGFACISVFVFNYGVIMNFLYLPMEVNFTTANNTS